MNSQVCRQAARQSPSTALRGHGYCLRSCGADTSTTTAACVYLRAVAAFWLRRPLSGISWMRTADMWARLRPLTAGGVYKFPAQDRYSLSPKIYALPIQSDTNDPAAKRSLIGNKLIFAE